MEKQPLQPLLDDLPEEGRARLLNGLERTRAGKSTDLRSPFYGRENTREEIISKLELAIGETSIQVLKDSDVREREKIGPYSIQSPMADRWDTVEPYFHQLFSADEECFSKAVKQFSALVPSHSLRMSTLQTAFDMMPTDTSLGLPWLTRDRSYVGDYLDRAAHLTDPSDLYPFVLYWRGQPTGPNQLPKQRVVWGSDHAETIRGATILYPMLNALRNLRGFSAWLGAPYVDDAMTRILTRANGKRIISMDYSGFDSSAHERLISAAFDVLREWFNEDAGLTLDLLEEIVLTAGLVVPDYVLLGRRGGIPSGTVVTNALGTIINGIAGLYVGFRSNSNLDDYELLGDDSVFLFSDSLEPENIAEIVGELGLVSNPEKQYVSTNAVHYLQRIHTTDWMPGGVCVGVRSPYRALNGMMSYERFRNDWNQYMDTSRWIMQCENVKHDPRFREFVQFLKDGDRVLKSGMSPIEAFRRAGGAEVIRSVLSIASFPYNVQNPERVRMFETTRILLELQ